MATAELTDDALKALIEELKSRKDKKKDLWERLAGIGVVLSTIGTLTLGAAGLWFTYSYNSRQVEIADRQGRVDEEDKRHQARILELQTVEKFMPHLTSGDEQKKQMALLMISTLGSPEFVTQFASISPSRGAQAAADTVMSSGKATTQRELPQSIATSTTASESTSKTKSGWVYLGHYVDSEKRWQTRYFDLGSVTDPRALDTATIAVSERTGSIYVRTGMPSLTGDLQKVIEVLKPPSKARVRSVKEWYTTGYMWAEVEYEARTGG